MFKKSYLTVEEFFLTPRKMLVIDLRGSEDWEPAIPGSKPIYLLKIFERLKEFEAKFDQTLTQNTILLYCRTEGGSKMLQSEFSKNYRVRYLKGGMTTYLETITKLLAEHSYHHSATREETMQRLLAALTNRHTSFQVLKNISNNLLGPKIK